MALPQSELREMDKVCKAFGNRRRLAIVGYLKRVREASVGNIAREIRLSLKSTSRHLAVLTAAGVLEKEQRSLNMFYCIAQDQKTLARSLTNFA